MATAGKFNATRIGVYVDGSLVTHATSGELSISANMIDVTTKDNAGWSESIAGLKSATLSVEAMFAFDAAKGFSDLFTALDNGTQVALKFGTAETGDTTYNMNAFITSLNNSAPMEEAATMSAEFQVSGAITATVNP